MTTQQLLNDRLWSRFIAAAWKLKAQCDTGHEDDRIWINSPPIDEPIVRFRVSRAAKAVSLSVTNSTIVPGLWLVMTPEFIDGSKPIATAVFSGRSELVPAVYDEAADRFALPLPNRRVEESEISEFFLRKAEELLTAFQQGRADSK